MSILVTGGAGFIGSALCKKLLKNGNEVIAVDNLITSTGENLAPLEKNPKFKFIKHDIIQPFHSVNRGLSTVNQIYHLACPTGVHNLGSLAEEMLLTCSMGTKNVLELAKVHNARFLFTSSSEVYGNPEVSPQKEEYTGNVDPTGFRSPYEEGKRFAESLTQMYFRKYKINTKIVRIFNTYGPGMSPKDNRVTPRFIRQVLNHQPLTIHGEGTQRRTFCYVDDLILGLITVMEKGERGEVYNLGSSQQIAILNLAKLIIKLSNSKSTSRFIKRPTHDHQSRLPDLTRIKRLGWRPKVKLKEGLKKTLSYYL